VTILGQPLSQRRSADSKAMVFARSAGPPRIRVLFIEDTVPLRSLGSGFVRANDIVRVMASLGCHVTVFPLNRSYFDVTAVFSDMPDTVEVMHDRTILDLGAFLASRQDYYDVVWIARAHNLDRVRATIERAADAAERKPRIILDAEAIASQRSAIRAMLSEPETSFDLPSALQLEFANASLCHTVVAVSAQDADALRELGLPRVTTVGHMREVRSTPRPFAARSGMLFVGAIHEMDSPNYDSLCWFVEDVLPLIEQALGWETRLTVVGYTAEKVSLDRFRRHPRVTLRGAVADLEPIYDTHRLFIAPTRYAAGAPYKVYEAASFGLPVVATDLLCRQMGWQGGIDLLAADSGSPDYFAELVVMLHREPAVWQRLRDNALQRLRAENGLEQYAAAIRAVLDA
jgi:glycosyltransferase involved in cell wall biosynthesis